MARDGVQLEFDSRDEAETDSLGACLARILQPGDFVALIGTLGAGKTRLVQSVAKALSVDSAEVGSPTFSLSRIYRAPDRTLNHIDLFRINDEDEFFELGIDECMDQGQIMLVEWAEKFKDCLPPDRLEIEIDVTGVTARRFRFRAVGETDISLLSKILE